MAVGGGAELARCSSFGNLLGLDSADSLSVASGTVTASVAVIFPSVDPDDATEFVGDVPASSISWSAGMTLSW